MKINSVYALDMFNNGQPALAVKIVDHVYSIKLNIELINITKGIHEFKITGTSKIPNKSKYSENSEVVFINKNFNSDDIKQDFATFSFPIMFDAEYINNVDNTYHTFENVKFNVQIDGLETEHIIYFERKD